MIVLRVNTLFANSIIIIFICENLLAARKMEKNQKITFVLTDESINTYGFRILMSGADLDQFQRNPVMFYNHDDWSMPIGRWENIRMENGQLMADPVFDEKDDNAAKIQGKVERGFLKMASIGFRVVETSEENNLMLPGQKYPTVTKWQLREASIVGIGANHNALRLYDENDQLLTNDKIFQLFDNVQLNSKNKNMDKEILKRLNLSDTATPGEIDAAVKQILSDNEKLRADYEKLKSEDDNRKEAEKKAKQEESVRLIDEAVKDGRLNAEGKANFLKLFDTDYESAKKALADIPKRISVKSVLDANDQGTNKELSDMASKTWDELDKAGKLVTLKEKYIDLYEEKFEQKFGKKPVKK
jgi:HK97 family phage prohead protease